MSCEEDGPSEQGPNSVGPCTSSSSETDAKSGDVITVTIGATVPTGFEQTAAEEVKEKIGVEARISKDRGRIYFPITTDKLFQVKMLPCWVFMSAFFKLTNIKSLCLINLAFPAVGSSSEVCRQPVCCR